jgi:hypothetical protein
VASLKKTCSASRRLRNKDDLALIRLNSTRIIPDDRLGPTNGINPVGLPATFLLRGGGVNARCGQQLMQRKQGEESKKGDQATTIATTTFRKEDISASTDIRNHESQPPHSHKHQQSAQPGESELLHQLHTTELHRGHQWSRP